MCGIEVLTQARAFMTLKSSFPGRTSARPVVKTVMQQLCSDTVMFLVWVVADMMTGSV